MWSRLSDLLAQSMVQQGCLVPMQADVHRHLLCQRAAVYSAVQLPRRMPACSRAILDICDEQQAGSACNGIDRQLAAASHAIED